MELEIFKNEWQQVKAPEILKEGKNESLIKRIKGVNRKIIFNNLISSIMLGMTIIFLGLIWSWYPGRSLFFYGSLLSIMLLIMISIILHWTRVLFWKNPDLTMNNKHFIDATLLKLYRSKFIKDRFMPFYNVFLVLGILLYTYDLTSGASIAWKIGLFSGTTTFSIIAIYLSRRIQLKQFKEGVGQLITELKELQAGFTK